MPASTTIGEACDLFIDVRTDASPATISNYLNTKRHLIRHFGENMPIGELTYEHAERFRAGLFTYRRYSDSSQVYRYDGKTLAKSTISQIIKNTKTIFSFLVTVEKSEFNPFERLKAPKREKKIPKEVTEADFEKLIFQASSINRSRHLDELFRARDTAILECLRSTGCRVGGVSSMQLCNLDFGESRARAVVKEKGGALRTVFLAESAAIALMVWLDVRPHTTNHDFIFVGLKQGTKNPAPLKENGIYLIIKRLRSAFNEAADLNEMKPITSPTNPHAFRHTFIRNMIKEGHSDAVIAQMTGHSVEVMREYYGNLFNSELERIHAESDWLK